MKEILALIPVLNGAHSIASVIQGVLEQGLDLMVVDDGSTDGTAEVVKALPSVKLMVHPHNLGKGAALRNGITQAAAWGYRAVLTLDADGQHNPAEIPKFMAAWKTGQYQLIIGSRMGSKDQGMPWIRQLSNGFSSWLLSQRIGQRVPDGQSGFRLYDTRLVSILPEECAGFVWETEILARAAQAGYRIGAVDITCLYPEGTQRSHYRAIRDSYHILRSIWRAGKKTTPQ